MRRIDQRGVEYAQQELWVVVRCKFALLDPCDDVVKRATLYRAGDEDRNQKLDEADARWL